MTDRPGRAGQNYDPPTTRFTPAKASRGEADRELDDADPVAGFASQYVNRWRLRSSATDGWGFVGRDVWTAALDDEE